MNWTARPGGIIALWSPSDAGLSRNSQQVSVNDEDVPGLRTVGMVAEYVE